MIAPHAYRLPLPMLGQLHAQLLELHPEMATDERLFVDTLDGESDVLELLRFIIRQAIDAETFEAALKHRREELDERAARFKARAARCRQFATEVMTTLQLKSVAAEDFNASVRDGRSAVRITDADALPERFPRTKVEPMKSEIGDALKAGQQVAGIARGRTPDMNRRVGEDCSAFLLVGVAFTGRDQAAQTFIDVVAPRTHTFAVAFDGRHQADMREPQLGPIAPSRDLEDDVRAGPLLLVFDEVDLGVRDVPDDLLARHKLCDLLGRAMEILVAIRKFSAELIGTAVNIARPPTTYVVHCREHLFRRLLDREGGRIISPVLRCFCFRHDDLLKLSFGYATDLSIGGGR